METSRLSLRPFRLSDCDRVEELLGDGAIAAMTGNIPHPYPKGGAEGWLQFTSGAVAAGLLERSAIVLRDGAELIGCMSLKRETASSHEAELAYWVGVPFWGHGYAAEAGACLIGSVGPAWELERVWAGVLPVNTRSVRVLERLGMRPDGEYSVTRQGRPEPVRLLRYCLDLPA